MNNVYMRLADHLKDLVMGYPFSEALLDLLKESFTPDEAQAALQIPRLYFNGATFFAMSIFIASI